VEKRVHALVEERRALEKRLDEAMRGGGDQVQSLIGKASPVEGVRLVAELVSVADVKSLQAMGDALREQLGSGVGVLGASLNGEGKNALLVVVTDDLRDRGIRADLLIRDIAAAAGGRGGGKPHMAQAGVPDAARLPEAIAAAPAALRKLLQDGAK
jgi:alanyl-tRNA synthetase